MEAVEPEVNHFFDQDLCRWCAINGTKEPLVTIGFTHKKRPVKACNVCDSRTDGRNGLIANLRRINNG